MVLTPFESQKTSDLGLSRRGLFKDALGWSEFQKETTDPKTQKRGTDPKTGTGGLRKPGINFLPAVAQLRPCEQFHAVPVPGGWGWGHIPRATAPPKSEIKGVRPVDIYILYIYSTKHYILSAAVIQVERKAPGCASHWGGL